MSLMPGKCAHCGSLCRFCPHMVIPKRGGKIRGKMRQYSLLESGVRYKVQNARKGNPSGQVKYVDWQALRRLASAGQGEKSVGGGREWGGATDEDQY